MPALVSHISPVQALISEMPQTIWRADQMGSYRADAFSSGHRALDDELPHGGWPHSALIELLLQQPGIGEMRLLRPVLTAIARKRRIALLQPPHLPQVAAWSAWGLPAERLLWIKTVRSTDALWTAEQILRNGSCGALLFWQPHVRTESLRRLHLAAQAADVLFWMVRPLATAQDSSPAPLRLGLRPAHGGVNIEIVKRRGPRRDEAFYLPLGDMPTAPPAPLAPLVSLTVSSSNHAFLDRRAPAAPASRNIPAALV